MRRPVLARSARELAREQAQQDGCEAVEMAAAEKASTPAAFRPLQPQSHSPRAPAADPGELVADVRALVGGEGGIDEAVLDAALRAWSVNTRRAFRSDLKLWDAWCRRTGVRTAEARAEDVASYVRALSGQDYSSAAARALKTRKPATIARYLVHIGWAYRMAGRSDPTAAPLVRLEHRAARAALETRQRQARAIRFKGDIADLDSPATGVCLAALLKATRRDLLGARDRALLLVAYDTGCRRSELVAIILEDIAAEADGSGILHITRSKTDREGQGALAYLSPAAMRAIRDWRKAGEIKHGALLRRVEVHFDGSVRRVGEGRSTATASR